MYNVLFLIDGRWTIYAKHADAQEAMEFSRILTDLDYEVLVERSRTLSLAN
jgi:hypothetical protein